MENSVCPLTLQRCCACTLGTVLCPWGSTCGQDMHGLCPWQADMLVGEAAKKQIS